MLIDVKLVGKFMLGLYLFNHRWQRTTGTFKGNYIERIIKREEAYGDLVCDHHLPLVALVSSMAIYMHDCPCEIVEGARRRLASASRYRDRDTNI